MNDESRRKPAIEQAPLTTVDVKMSDVIALAEADPGLSVIKIFGTPEPVL